MTMMEKKNTTTTPRPSWHRNRIIRSYIYQILLIILVVAFVYFIINNASNNMEKRGIKTGFAFLSSVSNFEILQTLIDYDRSFSYGRTFIVGLLNTLLVSVLGIITATILGFFMGIARLSPNWVVARLSKVYIETFRNIPLLLQLLFWYAIAVKLPTARQSISIFDVSFLSNRGFYIPAPIFEDGFGVVFIGILIALCGVYFLKKWAHNRQEMTGERFPTFLTSVVLLTGVFGIIFLAMGSPLSWDLPALKGFNFKGGAVIIPELVALWFGLTVYTGTFIAETVRAGVQAVDHGQTEAAYALGLKRGFTIRLVILPQALRIIIPPLTSQYLNLTKNSSLATAIAYPDIFAVFAGTTLNNTGQAIEIILMTMAVYLCFSLITSVIMNWYNKSVAIVER